jgi:hypothetical protein
MHTSFSGGESEIRVVDDPFPPQAVEARHFMPGRVGEPKLFCFSKGPFTGLLAGL